MNRRSFFKTTMASATLAAVNPLSVIPAQKAPAIIASGLPATAFDTPPDEFCFSTVINNVYGGKYYSVIEWTRYFTKCPALDPGHHIEHPYESGVLPQVHWDSCGESHDGYEWIRSADLVNYCRTWFKLKHQWLGCPEGWDKELCS